MALRYNGYMNRLYNNIIEALRAAQVSYRVTQHQAIFTSKEAVQIESIGPREEIKTLALLTDTEYIIVTLLQKEKLNLKALALEINTGKIKFVSPQVLQDKFGTVLGGLAPFGYGSYTQTSVYILDSVLTLKEIFISPGKNDITMEMTNSDFKKVVAMERIKILSSASYTV